MPLASSHPNTLDHQPASPDGRSSERQLDGDARSVVIAIGAIGVADAANVRTGSVVPIGGTAQTTDDSAAWVAQAREGSKTAFRNLFERHRAEVARLVYRMIGPRPEIEDLVQEVFVQVHRSIRDFRGDARFSTWLHRVTVNVVLMQRRAERSRPVFSEELAAGAVEDSTALSPDEEADRRARIGAFFEVLASVSEKKRVVFVLHDLEGLPPTEIAAIVDAPVLTVRTRLFYARRELEEKMRMDPLLARLVNASGGFAGDDEQSKSSKKLDRRKNARTNLTESEPDPGGRGEP